MKTIGLIILSLVQAQHGILDGRSPTKNDHICKLSKAKPHVPGSKHKLSFCFR